MIFTFPEKLKDRTIEKAYALKTTMLSSRHKMQTDFKWNFQGTLCKVCLQLAALFFISVS